MPPAGCPPSGSARRQSTTRWPPNFLSLRRSANFTSVCGDLLELERGGLDDLNASPRGGNPTAALAGDCGVGLRKKQFPPKFPKTAPIGLSRVVLDLDVGGGAQKRVSGAPAVSRGCA